MKRSTATQFNGTKPRAIVLDDDERPRKMISRRLRQRGFEVSECESFSEFSKLWNPGLFDLIVADWQLSARASEHGDKVLSRVRERDWDVPFILISGKLQDDEQRGRVLQKLLEGDQARFVKRGSPEAISKVCDEAEELLARRDSTLLKLILALRPAADADASFKTTLGDERVRDQLARLVSSPQATHRTLDPVAKLKSERAARRLTDG